MPFYRKIRSMGFEVEQVWDRVERRSKNVYSLPDSVVESMLNAKKKLDTSRSVSYIIIDDVRYRMTTIFERIGDSLTKEKTPKADPTAK